MASPELRELLPRIVRTNHHLDDVFRASQELGGYAPRRAHIREHFAALIDFLETGMNRTPLENSGALTKVDSIHVSGAWRTALERLSSDPDGAITAAKSLLESVCKHILDEAAEQYGTEDLPVLYRRAASHLLISPDQQVDETIRRMLGGAQQVVERVGALRNLMGDSHGHGQDTPDAETRHAELAVNMAGAIASFMIATWEAPAKR